MSLSGKMSQRVCGHCDGGVFECNEMKEDERKQATEHKTARGDEGGER